MFLNPDHITIAVADPEKAIAFFELLGFSKSHVAMIDGGAPAKYMGMPDMKAEHITLVLDGASPRVEIQLLAFEPVAGEDDGLHPTNLRRRGYNHLALRVDDVTAATAHLEAHGVTMLSEEMDYQSEAAVLRGTRGDHTRARRVGRRVQRVCVSEDVELLT